MRSSLLAASLLATAPALSACKGDPPRRLSGTATTAGDFQVQVTLKDASNKQGSKAFALECKWEPASNHPFNPRQFALSNLGMDSDTEPGASQYLWP